MENLDPDQAARVWQRVRGEAPDRDAKALEQLIVREWESASVCLNLARRSSGRLSASLQQLGLQEQAQCACLRGLYFLMTGEHFADPDRKTGPQGEMTLRGCYERQMRNMRAYAERASDPEHGHVFRKLGEQEQEHCRMLLELIGSQGKRSQTGK